MPQRSRILALALAVCIAAVAGSPAHAQDDGGTSTSTTSTTAPPTTTTTVPGGSTTTTAPGGSTTTTVPEEPPADDPAALDDAPVDSVPDVDVTVPPRELTPEQEREAFRSAASRLVRVNTRTTRAQALESQAALESAVDERERVEGALARLERRFRRLSGDLQVAVQRYDDARARLAERATEAFVRGQLLGLDRVLEADDPGEVERRTALMRTVLDADDAAVDDFREARLGLREDLRDLVADLNGTRSRLAEAERAEEKAEFLATSAHLELAVFERGGSIVITNFVFPVGEPYSFTDSFGAPRMTDTEYEHLHEGTDIFAPAGTSLYAVERGVITRMGTDVLGGIKIWLKGESGTHYYYAHLTGYADGMHEGLLVEAGDEVGFVGNTGNARGTPSHLHFEIHPEGGPGVNPYPLLQITDELRRLAAATSTAAQSEG